MIISVGQVYISEVQIDDYPYTKVEIEIVKIEPGLVEFVSNYYGLEHQPHGKGFLGFEVIFRDDVVYKVRYREFKQAIIDKRYELDLKATIENYENYRKLNFKNKNDIEEETKALQNMSKGNN